MKFGQLIEYNMNNIFLEKSYKMWWRNYFQNLFLKIEIEHISLTMANRGCIYCIPS